jgi:hypothetical protein
MKSVSILLDKIKFIQFPENFVHLRLLGKKCLRTQVIDGNWDQVLSKKIYWSSMYEHGYSKTYDWRNNSGLIELDSYFFYTALKSHFLEGRSWNETEWFEWLSTRSGFAPIKRYRNSAEILERLVWIEKLFERMRSGKYVPKGQNPRINIGRHGRVAIEDGRHRLCLAKIAGLQHMRVDISVVHAVVQPKMRFFSSRWQDLVNDLDGEIA